MLNVLYQIIKKYKSLLRTNDTRNQHITNNSINNLCFVIMGFGPKPNYPTGEILNLDKTYNDIIKPAVESTGMQCIRASDINLPGQIDTSMYQLLFHSKLIIADISTLNANAIYELGVRHALKPSSTIIIQENNHEAPIKFDLSHQRILQYKHAGKYIEQSEIIKLKTQIQQYITNINKNKPHQDSPVYDFLNTLVPPKMKKHKCFLDEISKVIHSTEVSLSQIQEKALKYMQDKNWIEAYNLWNKASTMNLEEIYYKQQSALCLYKSNTQDEYTLKQALHIIMELDPNQTSRNTETLGIGGAIAKRLYKLTENTSHIILAKTYYERGYHIQDNFYNGENYALCLDFLATHQDNEEDKKYMHIGAKKLRQTIIQNFKHKLKDASYTLTKWEYATLAHCHYALNNEALYFKYKQNFINSNPDKWNQDTFLENINDLKKLLKREIEV